MLIGYIAPGTAPLGDLISNIPFLDAYWCMLWLWNPGAGVLPGLCISASSDRVSSLCPFLKLICTPEISFLMFASSCYISPTFDAGPPIVAMAAVPPPLFALLLLVISSFLLLLNREDDWPVYNAPP